MENLTKTYSDCNVRVEISRFEPVGGIAEYHALLHAEPVIGELFETQLARIEKAKLQLLVELGDAVKIVFQRYLVSDSANQARFISLEGVHATSIIQQTPLDGSKAALLIYMQRGTDISRKDDMTIVNHNGYTHLWTYNHQTPEGDSYLQTHKLMFEYEAALKANDTTFADNCIRTWFYVRDVDSNYAGMVKGRRENFEHIGLTPQTHYVASTGIGGSPSQTLAKVQFEAYAMKGFASEQQEYLKALTHLNPTYEYGVTFERGTRMTYGDRSHVIISGTASINNHGEILHEGNVEMQTKRMWENVEALLKEGGATYDDVAYMVVYLRDISDFNTVKSLYLQRFPDKPKVFVQAPVCRPGWLIEMECIAISNNGDKRFKDF